MTGMRLSLIALIIVLVSACSGGSVAVKGKVIDGKGRPLSGIKVIAVQKGPVKDTGRFETSTGSDGAFRLRRLLPASQYVISPESPAWKTSAAIVVHTGTQASAEVPPVSLTVRFTTSDEGVVTDSKNGLQWVPAPVSSVSWSDGVRYAESLTLGGGGWRLPTREELRDLYDESSDGHADPAFRIDRHWVWTSEAKDDGDAWFFNFENGYEDGHTKEWVLTRGRVLVVRPQR